MWRAACRDDGLSLLLSLLVTMIASRGMGSLRERRPGAWEIRVVVAVDPVTGRSVQRSVMFRGSAAEADTYRAELAEEYAARRAVTRAAPFVTVAELLDRWLLADHRWKPSTLVGYRSNARQLTNDTRCSFTGYVNTLYGGFKVGQGVVLLTVGTAEDVTGIGAILGVPTQAYGGYQLVTGVARIYRGATQEIDAFHHPTECKSPCAMPRTSDLTWLHSGGALRSS